MTTKAWVRVSDLQAGDDVQYWGTVTRVEPSYLFDGKTAVWTEGASFPVHRRSGDEVLVKNMPDEEVA